MSRGWRRYVQPWGGSEGRGDKLGGGWLCLSPPPWASNVTPTPQEASSSLGLRDQATFLPTAPSPAHVTLPTSYSTRAPGQSPGQPWRKGQWKLHSRDAHTGHLLFQLLQVLPCPGPPPGAQTWALKLATVLSKVIFRPSDLQVPFSVTLGEPRAPSTQGHPPFPSPAWPHCPEPSSWQENHQDLLLVLRESDQPCPVQEEPVPLNPGGPCPAARPTLSPALSAGLQDLRKPSVCWRSTYFLPA